MSLVLWILVGVLVAVLAGLQLVGVRALAALGIEPSRAVLSLRIANFVIALAVIVYAAIVWTGR